MTSEYTYSTACRATVSGSKMCGKLVLDLNSCRIAYGGSITTTSSFNVIQPPTDEYTKYVFLYVPAGQSHPWAVLCGTAPDGKGFIISSKYTYSCDLLYGTAPNSITYIACILRIHNCHNFKNGIICDFAQ